VTAEDKLQASVRELRSLALPLGWRDTADPEDRREPAPYVDGLGAVVGSHLLGWLLTAMAVSLGAPFWFDLLNKLVSVRVSGNPPEKKSARA
jgi:hypothetical protein